MAALPGYLTQIYLCTTNSVAFSNFVLTDKGDHKTFNAGTDPKRFWDETKSFTVQTSTDGTTWTAAPVGTYTVQYCGGVIILNTALVGATPSVRVTGQYMPISFLGDAKEIDIKNNVTLLDTTAFQNPPSPWQTNIANLAGAEITIAKWYVDTTFQPFLGNRMVIVAYNGANPNQRYECYARLKDDSLKFAVNAVNTEDLGFTVNGAVYFYQS